MLKLLTHLQSQPLTQFSIAALGLSSFLTKHVPFSCVLCVCFCFFSINPFSYHQTHGYCFHSALGKLILTEKPGLWAAWPKHLMKCSTPHCAEVHFQMQRSRTYQESPLLRNKAKTEKGWGQGHFLDTIGGSSHVGWTKEAIEQPTKEVSSIIHDTWWLHTSHFLSHCSGQKAICSSNFLMGPQHLWPRQWEVTHPSLVLEGFNPQLNEFHTCHGYRHTLGHLPCLLACYLATEITLMCAHVWFHPYVCFHMREPQRGLPWKVLAAPSSNPCSRHQYSYSRPLPYNHYHMERKDHYWIFHPILVISGKWGHYSYITYAFLAVRDSSRFSQTSYPGSHSWGAFLLILHWAVTFTAITQSVPPSGHLPSLQKHPHARCPPEVPSDASVHTFLPTLSPHLTLPYYLQLPPCDLFYCLQGFLCWVGWG